MSKFITTAFTVCAIVAISGTAQAKDHTSNVSFKYDNTAPVAQSYAQLEKTATVACQDEAERVGYRRTESITWQLRKCKSDFLNQAVKSIGNRKLIAFHKGNVNPRAKNIQLASTK